MPEPGDQTPEDVFANASSADWASRFVSQTSFESILGAKQKQPDLSVSSKDACGSTISRRTLAISVRTSSDESGARLRSEDHSLISKIAFPDGRSANISYGCFGEVCSIEWNDGTRFSRLRELSVSQTDGTISFKDTDDTTHRILPGGPAEQIWSDGSRSLIKYSAGQVVTIPPLFSEMDKSRKSQLEIRLFPSEVTYANGSKREFKWQDSNGQPLLCEIKQADGSVWKNLNGTWQSSGKQLEISHVRLSENGVLSYRDSLGVLHNLLPNGKEEITNKGGQRFVIERDKEGKITAVINVDGSRTEVHLVESLLPIDDARLRSMALSHYNLDTINDVASRLALLNTLNSNDRAKLTGSSTLIDSAQVRGQLANGKLADSDNRFLLTDIAAKLEELRNARSEMLSRCAGTIEHLAGQKAAQWKDLGQLMSDGNTDWRHPFDENRIPFESQEWNCRKAIDRTQAEICCSADRLQQHASSIMRTNLAADVYDYTQLKLGGRTLDADLKAAGMIERFGVECLKALAPDVYLNLKNEGWQRLKDAGITQLNQLPEYSSAASRADFRAALSALQQNSKTPSLVSDCIAKQALRAIDSQPEIGSMLNLSAALRQGLSDLQTMYSIGCSGTKTDGFVEQARALKSELENSMKAVSPAQVRELAKEMNDVLRNKEVPLTKLARTELEKRVEQLQQLLSLVEPDSIQHKSLQRMFTAIDSNAFDSNTLLNWLKDDAPMILATSAAFAGTFAATGGWGLLLGPLVAQGVGMATQDLLYGTEFGPGTRSSLANYLKGESIIETNTRTGQCEERQAELWKDVAKPQLQEYIHSFAFIGLTELTLGCATVMKDALLKKVAQCGEQASTSFIANAARTIQENTNKLRQLERMAQQHPESRSAIENLLRGVKEDLKFQSQQKLLEKGIQIIGSRESAEDSLSGAALSFAVTVGLIMANRGINFATRCRRLEKSNHFEVMVPKPEFLSGIDELRRQGCIVDQQTNGMYRIKLCDGSEIVIKHNDESAPQKSSAAEKQMEEYARTGRLEEKLVFGAINKGHDSEPNVSDHSRAGIMYSEKFAEVVQRFEAGFPDGALAKLLNQRGPGDALTQKILASQFSKYLNEISPGFDADAYVGFMEHNAGKDIDLTTLLASKGMGSCSVDAMALKALADHYGLKATLVRGNADGGNQINHAWVELEFSDGTRALFGRGHDGKMGKVSDSSKYRSAAQIEKPIRDITQGIKRNILEQTREAGDSITGGLHQTQVDRINAVLTHLEATPKPNTPEGKLLLCLTQNIDTTANDESARTVAELLNKVHNGNLIVAQTLKGNWLNPTGETEGNCQACTAAHIINQSLDQLEMVKYLSHWLGKKPQIRIVIQDNNVRLTAQSCEDIDNSFRTIQRAATKQEGFAKARSASSMYIERLLEPAGLALGSSFSDNRFTKRNGLSVIMDDVHVWTRNSDGTAYCPQKDRSEKTRTYKTETKVWKTITASEHVREALNESERMSKTLIEGAIAAKCWPDMTAEQLRQHLVNAEWTAVDGVANQPKKAFRARIPGGRLGTTGLNELPANAKLYLTRRSGDNWSLVTSDAKAATTDTAIITVETKDGERSIWGLRPEGPNSLPSTTSELLAQHHINTTDQTERIEITREQALALGLNRAMIR